MSERDTSFVGAIPALYDRHLGPCLFAPYAADLAARVARQGPRQVLEIAAGTGILTRALRQALPGDVTIVATDLNQPMLDHAARSLPGDGVVWRQADGTALPFDDASVDAVVCQFGVMFFPDKLRGFREARRVLRPGGRYWFSVWDRIEENPAAEIVHRTVAALFPQDPPSFLARTPYGHHDAAPLRRGLENAGFGEIEITTVALRARAPSCRDPAAGLCLGSPLRGEIEARDAGKLQEAVDRAAAAIAARYGEGPIDTPQSALVVSAAR